MLDNSFFIQNCTGDYLLSCKLIFIIIKMLDYIICCYCIYPKEEIILCNIIHWLGKFYVLKYIDFMKLFVFLFCKHSTIKSIKVGCTIYCWVYSNSLFPTVTYYSRTAFYFLVLWIHLYSSSEKWKLLILKFQNQTLVRFVICCLWFIIANLFFMFFYLFIYL